jgi:hypothetical protein
VKPLQSKPFSTELPPSLWRTPRKFIADSTRSEAVSRTLASSRGRAAGLGAGVQQAALAQEAADGVLAGSAGRCRRAGWRLVRCGLLLLQAWP